MGSTIGIIGSKAVVPRMMALAKDYPQFSFLDLSYFDERDAVDIFRRNQGRMHVCLFTGPWAYTKVLSSLGPGGPGMPMVYAHHAGALHQTISRMLYEGADLSRISIDVVNEDDAEETFSEIGYRPEKIYLMPFRGAVPREHFIEFHRDLWHSGKTTSMITLLATAHRHLKEENLPVFHCRVGQVALREAFARAVLQLQALQMSEQQTVVGLVSMEGALSLDQDAKERFLQYLVRFGEEKGLGVVPMEGASYALFLTRGTLRRLTKSFQSFTLPAGAVAAGSRMFFGFGVGPTVNLCHAKAVLALNYARQRDESCAYVVFDSGEVFGPLVSDSSGLAYNRRSIDEKVLASAEQAGLSVVTLSKVKAAVESVGSMLITPEQLADSLRISKRNSRRILVKLCDAGLATILGMDQPGTRGRPQRVFQVHLD